MPILELTNEDMGHRCAACGAERRVAMTSLQAGDEGSVPNDIAEDLVRAPPCAGCGATEFLIRSPDTAPPHPAPGSFGHLHRLLVDELHSRLVEQGRVPGALKQRGVRARTGARRAAMQEEARRWFPTGMKIERHIVEQLATKEPAQ